KRDPHEVLGVDPGATPTQIKAAWRKLARRHHPDLTGDDPAASRVATRLMAEINEAYAALTRGGTGRAGRGTGDDWSGTTGAASGAARRARPPRRGQRALRAAEGPPRPSPSRPVPGGFDTTGTSRPRNQPLRDAEAA